MKTMARILGLSIIGVLFAAMMLQLTNIDIRREELNSAIDLAMTQTQTVMEEQLTDDIYGTNTARKRFATEEEYFEDFCNNFQKLISSTTTYKIDLLTADIEKGLLDINVNAYYRDVLGKEHQMSKRKTSIIEQVDLNSAIDIYHVTYDLDHGRVLGINPTTFSSRSTEDLKLKNPTKLGYKFIGWTGSNGTTPQIDVTIDKMAENDLYFTANYEIESYDIHYDLNDKDDGNKASNEGNPTTYNIETPDFKIKSPTRLYYDFTGWTGTNGNSPQVEPVVTRGHTGHRTYLAHWKLGEKSIRYELNGGTNNPNNPATYTVKTPNIVLKNPTKEGYDFKGWYTDPGLTQKITKIDTSTYIDYTLYAKWEGKSITVVYHSNGADGKADSVANKKYQVGNLAMRWEFYQGLFSNPIDNLYYSKGWNTVSSVDQLQAPTIKSGDKITDQMIINYVNSGKTKIDLYAHTQPRYLTVHYYDQSGNFITDQKYYATKASVSTTYTKEELGNMIDTEKENNPTSSLLQYLIRLYERLFGPLKTQVMAVGGNQVYMDVTEYENQTGYRIPSSHRLKWKLNNKNSDSIRLAGDPVTNDDIINFGKELEVGVSKELWAYAEVKANIIYGYQTPAAYSSTGRSTPPEYYKEGIVDKKWMKEFGGTPNLWSTNYELGDSVKVKEISISGYCHTSGSYHQLYLDGNYIGKLWVRSDNEVGTYNMSSNITSYSSMAVRDGGGHTRGGYWTGNRCDHNRGESADWGEQVSQVSVKGTIPATAYFEVISWNPPIRTPLPEIKSPEMRIVYSRDDGLTWQECKDGICPNS